MTAAPRRRVAVLPWGTPIEEFLDPIGVDLDGFCDEMSGCWFLGCCAALARAGWQPTLVVSSRQVRTRTVRRHAPTGTPVVVLPAPRPAGSRPAGWRRDLAAYRACLVPGLRKELGRHDVVLVQEYEEPRTDLLALWARVRRLPLAATFQGGAPPWELAPLQRRLRGPAVRALPALLIGSAAEAERVTREHRIDPTRIHAVANPVDTQAWAPGDRDEARRALELPQDAFVVAWHGRVELLRKGLDVLLHAWSDLCEARPDADLRLLLTGAGQDDDALAELVEEWGTRGVTWLRDYADHDALRLRVAACDVWVSLSRHEGFAVAPAEAMSSSRPVVLSEVPGAAELIGRHEAHGGVLVPVVDAAAVTAALRDALDGCWVPDAAARGRAARRRVEQELSLEAVGAQLTEGLLAAQAAMSPPRRRIGPRLTA